MLSNMSQSSDLRSPIDSSPRSLAAAPSPRGLPLFGHVLDAWRDPIGLLTRSARELGDFVRFRFGPFDFVFLSASADIHRVLVENHKNYKKSRSYDGIRIVLGRGLLTSEGEHWKKQRRLAQPAFHHQRLKGFAATMAAATRDLVARWRDLTEPFDLHREMMRLTFRMVGLTLLSTDVEGDAVAFGRALDVALRWANEYGEQAVRIAPWFPTPKNLRYRRAKQTLDELVQRIIVERRNSGDPGSDLLGLLLAARDETTGEGMSDEELRDEMLTLVLAGHETTANALTWAFYLLAKNPAVADKLRAEIREVLRDREPAFEDLPRLVYAERVVQESMRLYPPAWALERAALADDVVGGYRIPARTTIVIAPYTMHRDPRCWDDPERFDPDRFAPDRFGDRQKLAYLPFGDGPRICIGKGFAMMEAKIALVMIAQCFVVELCAPDAIGMEPAITLRPKRAVTVRARAVG
jgi:cytochrome P450